MARTEIAVVTLPSQGGADIVTTAGDATNGHQFDNDGATLLFMDNGGVGASEITITSVDDEFGRAEDIVHSVPAGGQYIAGPFIQSIWDQPGRKILVDLDVDTSVTLAALRYSPRR